MSPPESHPDQPRIRALISYARDEGEHDAEFLALAQRLRTDGIDCLLDQFILSPPQGWSAWTEETVRDSRWVLVVASATYQCRAEGKADPGTGLGVIWEHGQIRRELYERGRINKRFVPIGFGKQNRAHVPTVLSDYTYFNVSSETDYERLLRYLTGQPEIIPHPLGPVPVLEAREAALERSTGDPEEIALAYAAESETDSEFFGGQFHIPNYIGVFDMRVRPARRIARRLSRDDLAPFLRSQRAWYAVRSNVPDELPFSTSSSVKGFGSGLGVEIATLKPKFKQCEAIRLHASGQYRLMRVFEEDYADDHMLSKLTDWELWCEHFVRRVSLLHVLARNIARTLGLQPQDDLQFKLTVSGLRNRRILPADLYPDIQVAALLSESHPGTDLNVERKEIVTLGELERTVLSRARDFTIDALWNFGVTGPETTKYITRIQKEMVGSTEPDAIRVL
jgi:hypothetical protein